jgi:hypothetical protein
MNKEYGKTSFILLGILVLFACENHDFNSQSINLVPSEPSDTPSYWCTWATHNYGADTTVFMNANFGINGHSGQANVLTEDHLFDPNGWLVAFPKAQKDLYVMYDAGWDVPFGVDFDGNQRWKLGSLELADDKFPSCTGNPAERLTKLNQMTKDAGWKGAAIWIAAHPYGYGQNGKFETNDEIEAYYRERVRWCKEAGVEYWKVDYGYLGGDLKFREMLTRIAAEEYHGMWVEHCIGGGPFNDDECPWDTPNFGKTGRYANWDNKVNLALQCLEFSDVFRTYDVTSHLSIPTTIDRCAAILKAAKQKPASKAILNCEDEPYLGAVLGSAIGIMRHPSHFQIDGYYYDPLHVKTKTNEVERAVLWQRIAPAFSVGMTPINVSDEILKDTYTFKKGDTWANWAIGQKIMQAAPARIARNMALPVVESNSQPPFVICCKNPNNSIAVATLGRVNDEKGFYFPSADVTIKEVDWQHHIGIFGRYKSLTLEGADIPAESRIFAQDLIAEEATDITSMVEITKNSIVISGKVIENIGLASASKNDTSAPGMVLKVIF